MSIVTGSSFTGENFVQVPLPDYDNECKLLSKLLYICGAILILFVLLPRKLSYFDSYEITTTTVKVPKNNKDKEKQPETTEVKNLNIRRVPSYARWISLFGIMITLYGMYNIIQHSPYNRFLLRRAFVVPILTEEECSKIIDIAENVAVRNYNYAQKTIKEYQESDKDEEDYEDEEEYKESVQLLQEPKGWQKLRHGTYPTTDLSVENDLFTNKERQWIIDLLDRRLAPMLSRLFGVPYTAMRAYDLFIVQYGANHQAALERHMDGGDIGVTLLLNDEFEGGGTRYYDRRSDEPFHHVQTKQVGNLITHPALMDHEGFPITEGKRYILVVLLDIDRTLNAKSDGIHTGISPFASYLNINWVYRRIANYHSEHMGWIRKNCSKRTRDFMYRILKAALSFSDQADHKVEYLVRDKDATSFIQAIEKMYDPNTPKPRWI